MPLIERALLSDKWHLKLVSPSSHPCLFLYCSAGALAASAATFVGHYPWFAVYNTLNDALPAQDELKKRLLRSAFIGTF